ncbi:MAG: septum site-determining protein MinC [Ruminiclostridium sp.]|nr:septum site-determining protein MinC [Ruminiclostridium sp.]
MEENVISFKATVNGLILILREEDDFDTIFRHIEMKVASSGRFFKGASIGVKYRGRKLSAEEESKLTALLATSTGAEIKSFEEDIEQLEKSMLAESTQTREKPKMRLMYFKGLDEGMTKFYKGTVRSGNLVSFEGNLVVIGDVNPGGEIIATGNVIVMGSLRGIVHAGADGNKEAVVAALNLQPTQLRIADVITRSPDIKGGKTAINPEMAFVKDDMVYIESFLPQHK